MFMKNIIHRRMDEKDMQLVRELIRVSFEIISLNLFKIMVKLAH